MQSGYIIFGTLRGHTFILKFSEHQPVAREEEQEEWEIGKKKERCAGEEEAESMHVWEQEGTDVCRISPRPDFHSDVDPSGSLV